MVGSYGQILICLSKYSPLSRQKRERGLREQGIQPSHRVDENQQCIMMLVTVSCCDPVQGKARQGKAQCTWGQQGWRTAGMFCPNLVEGSFEKLSFLVL